MTKYNFSAGPAILPQSVLQQLSQSIVDYKSTGLSILELSHRGDLIVEMLDEAHALVRELLNLPRNYKVIYLTGGATTHFGLIPYNLLPQNKTAAYVNTGTWSDKAINYARHYGNVEVVASSKDANFNYIPKNYDVPNDAQYLYVTSNNTIYGTMLKQMPKANCPVFIDMSSDIFSQPINATDYGLIYAASQKNLGPVGTTLLIVNEELLGQTGRDIPPMFDYRAHIKKKSALNTPPVFSIYGCLLTLRWIKEKGLENIAAANKAKAGLLYTEIDRNPHFKGTAAIEDRSTMNATFVCTQPEMESRFLQLCEQNGIVGIKGHRSVGGFRASMYNALELKAVEVLVELMRG